MSLIEFAGGEFHVDAVLLAEEFGVEPSTVPDLMRDGKITSRYERGVDDDLGSHRLTFFYRGRPFRLVVNGDGKLVDRSTFG